MKRLLALSLFLAMPASAECRWQWTCDGLGNCSNVPICDSTLEVPPPKPASIRPLAPLSVRPVPTPVVPPVGTTSCTPMQVRDAWGGWSWQTICR